MKKVLIAAFAVGLTAASILLSVPKTQAAGTSPVVIASQQSAGNFGIGPANIVGSDVTNLRNETDALGVWMDEHVQSLRSVCN